MLIFASLLEQQAVVLGDHGIHARIGEAEWKAAVDALVAGMRRGAPGQGFEEAIDLVRRPAGRALPARRGHSRPERAPRRPEAGPLTPGAGTVDKPVRSNG